MMLNFRIVPIPYLSQTLLKTWVPDDWAKVSRDLNPWSDPFLDRINLLIYNLKRQAWVRSPEVVGFFFERFEWQYKAQILAEFDYYYEQVERFINIRRAYIFDFYLMAEVDSFMDSKPRGDWAKEYAVPKPDELPYFYLDQSIYRDSLESFEWKINSRYNRVANRFKEEHGRFKPLPPSRYGGIDKLTVLPLVPWESIIHDQFNHLLFEFAQLSRIDNSLEGVAAKQRAFLKNGAIPIPNRHTILGWYALCGHEFFRIKTTSVMDVGLGHFLCYSLPCLPMTLEHSVGNSIPGDDSDSDQSLGYKSAAHDRTAHGRIKHGRWESDSVLLLAAGGDGVRPERNLIARRLIKNGTTSSTELVRSALSMLPIQLSGEWPEWMKVWSPIPDPELASYDPLRMRWGTDRPHSFDTGMRALSKWHRIHLAFSDDEIGALAATEWRQAFESELLSFLALNQTEVLKTIFDACLIRQTVTQQRTPAKPGRKPRTDFGFGDWNL